VNHSTNIIFCDTCYEIRFKGTIIFMITKFSGESQQPENITWQEVPQFVKQKTLEEIRSKLDEH